MVKFQNLVGDLMFVQPELDLSEVQVKADKNRPWGSIVESLHYLSLAKGVVCSDIDVLAADWADDLPKVDS